MFNDGKSMSDKIGTFGWAINEMKAGSRVFRRGWNGKNMWIAIQQVHTDGDMTVPYIYIKTADNQRVPWLASQTDMLVEDWEHAVVS